MSDAVVFDSAAETVAYLRGYSDGAAEDRDELQAQLATALARADADRAALLDIKAMIEWSVNPSTGGASHFIVNRPMADMAMVYAAVCAALAAAAPGEGEA